MIESQLTQFLIPKPFAVDGAIEHIVNESDTKPNFKTGFPLNFSAPHSAGGEYVARTMMNAVGNMATANEYYRQAGGLYQFNADWAVANNGYPRGAVLDFLDGTKLYKVLSLVDNNLVDYTGNIPTTEQETKGVVAGSVDGVNWVYCNVDQEVKYNEICNIPNFSWYGDPESAIIESTFDGDTFPIGYVRVPRDGYIQIIGTLTFTSSLIRTSSSTLKYGGFGIVACTKQTVSGETIIPNPWRVKGTLVYQRGKLWTYQYGTIDYQETDITTMQVAAGQEIQFYVINRGGNVSNSDAKIVLI